MADSMFANNLSLLQTDPVYIPSIPELMQQYKECTPGNPPSLCQPLSLDSTHTTLQGALPAAAFGEKYTSPECEDLLKAILMVSDKMAFTRLLELIKL